MLGPHPFISQCTFFSLVLPQKDMGGVRLGVATRDFSCKRILMGEGGKGSTLWRKYLMVGIYALYHGKHGSKIGDLGRWIVLEKTGRAATWNRLGKISTQALAHDEIVLPHHTALTRSTMEN